jgi:hypothetical protein
LKRYLISIVVLCVLILAASRVDVITALPQAELKYRLAESVGGEPFRIPCPPIQGGMPRPISRGKPFAEVVKDEETFQVILNHLGWAGVLNSSEEQKSRIAHEASKLDAVFLEPSNDGFHFWFDYADPSEWHSAEGAISRQGLITIARKGPPFQPYPCPICLVGNTLIDTPSGPIAVSELRVGMSVWTANALGKLYAARILKTARVSVSWGHPVVHIRLSDGRELWASPAHPTADGRALGSLRRGDIVDGAQVFSLEQLAYPDTMTYDILPAGNTGFYWANGILMGSTLARTAQWGDGAYLQALLNVGKVEQPQ